jgi:hypothetical protein
MMSILVHQRPVVKCADIADRNTLNFLNEQPVSDEEWLTEHEEYAGKLLAKSLFLIGPYLV